MGTRLLVLFALFSLAFSAPISWPAKYYATGFFSIPYFNIVEPLTANYDATLNRQRFDYYESLDSYIYLYNTGVLFEIVPRIDTLVCRRLSAAGSSLQSILPDVTGWQNKGTERVNGLECSHYQLITNNQSKIGTYDFWVFIDPDTQIPRPVKLVMNAFDTIFGSHPDIYILEYNAYIPNYNTPDAYTPPKNLTCAAPDMPMSLADPIRARIRLGGLAQITSAPAYAPEIPSDDHYGQLFEEHVNKYSKRYSSQQEYASRLAIFSENAKALERLSSTSSFKLSLNHFADLSSDEFSAVMLPRSYRPATPESQLPPTLDASLEAYYAKLLPTLPTSVNWTDKGAVTKVKDQGVCGSCWTFGTTGTIEGAWAIKTGKLVSLSEQQVVDCAWGFDWSGPGGNQACDGGYAAGALQFVINNGGIATESSYPYLMQDAYCAAKDKSSGVQLTGYVNVTMGSEAALQAAVALGPVAVAIDASHDSFRWYQSGVYYEPACSNALADLDHEVLAVGYGEENGQKYWLVKNSWSTHWGDNGYIKMSRDRGNNCGIATQANYALA